MKHIYTSLAFLVLVLATSCTTTRDYAQNYTESQDQDITYQQFYDDLSPYGNWVDYSSYGYVWVPNEIGFRPYYNNGHWIYTNYGWTWASNYNWGWAPFHYGRWLYDDIYGWMWMPGYEWAPAWVSWRSGNGCYGWAPLGPGSGFGMGSDIPYSHWAFVPNRYINSPRINNYYIDRQRNVTIIQNTTVINNTNNTNVPGDRRVYTTGPSATEVEKATNEKIRPVRIIQKNAPGNTNVSGSTVSIYKPAVKQTPQQTEQIKPSRVVKLDELKARRENTGAAQKEIPVRTEGNTAPSPYIKAEPMLNNKTITNPSAGNERTPVIQKQNPVIEKQVQPQQPQRVVSGQPAPDQSPANLNREESKNAQIRDVQQQNNINNKPPAEINTPPAKVRVIRQPNINSEDARQNVPPAPVTRQPVQRQENIIRQQQVQPPAERQVNRPSVDRAPIIRNQESQETREIRRDAPQKGRR